uniref:Protein KTI12-like protein n=1 Tax=Triticum urartu TaxID=4572 RepID=A0A8R7QL72_TRIUA
MALVVMCGQPCSGKSEAAACLAAALRSSVPDVTVRVIDESSLHLGRNESYKDMVVEKNLRGVLRSEVDRSVSRDGIIIVDSLNNIKGYRYELWCLARASGIRYCVKWTIVGIGTSSVRRKENPHMITIYLKIWQGDLRGLIVVAAGIPLFLNCFHLERKLWNLPLLLPRLYHI